MYNDTCSRHEIMMQNKPEAKSKWVRTCPKGVKSCFWAQGNGIGGWYQGNGIVVISKLFLLNMIKLLKIIENNLWHLFDFSEHRFRGCADALFIHDNKCTKELQRKIYINKLCNIFQSGKSFHKKLSIFTNMGMNFLFSCHYDRRQIIGRRRGWTLLLW